MALELQSQAMGALQSMAGVATSLRSYKEHKEYKERTANADVRNKKYHEKKMELTEAKIETEKKSLDLMGVKAQKYRAEARDLNSKARQRNYTLKREKALDTANDALLTRQAEINVLQPDPTEEDKVGDILKKLGGA